MKINEEVKRTYTDDTMYEVYDETDTEHCIFIGSFRTLKEAAKAAKEHKMSFPGSVVQAYELVRE
jgi:hypothetical protein